MTRKDLARKTVLNQIEAFERRWGEPVDTRAPAIPPELRERLRVVERRMCPEGETWETIRDLLAHIDREQSG